MVLMIGESEQVTVPEVLLTETKALMSRPPTGSGETIFGGEQMRQVKPLAMATAVVVRPGMVPSGG
jgi:acyl-CoA hydrolase